MSQIDDLNAAIAKLAADVQALINLVPAGSMAPAPDLTAATASVTAMDAQVGVALNPPSFDVAFSLVAFQEGPQSGA